MGSVADDRELVRRHGLYGFMRCAWPRIEACELVREPHMPLVCAHYEAVGRGEIKDLVVEIPPGTTKSTLTSILWPAYDKIDAAWRKWLFTSYSEKLSLSFATRELSLITSDWYRERWPGIEVVGGGRAAAGDFWIEYNGRIAGRRFSTMMEGAATGVHAHILVADDPHKPSELKLGGESAKRNLDKDWDSWTRTFSSRHADPATFSRVVIAQRLHQEDISGRMVKSPRTVRVHLPMEFVPKRKMKTKWGEDWRTKEGELLAPKRFPPSVIEDKKHPVTGMSKAEYAAQMQQLPAPEGGNLFLEEWFARRWHVLPPKLSNWFLSVDAAFKDKKSSDFVAIGLYAMNGNQPYMIDLINERLSFTATCERILQFHSTWPQLRSYGATLVEDKANGPAIIDALKSEITGLVPIEPRGSKLARAMACTPKMKGEPGMVFPQNLGILNDFIDQAKNFPMASYDDMVDQLSQAWDWIGQQYSSEDDFLAKMRRIAG